MIKQLVCKCQKVKWFGNIMLIELKLPPLDNLSFLPGQFVNVMLPNKIARAYSISKYLEDQNGDIIELCVEYIEGGRASEFFKNLSIGEEILIKGPFGRFIPSYYDFSTKLIKFTSGRMIFLGTGTGIVPIFNMVYDLSNQIATNRELLKIDQVCIYHGVRNESETYYDESFRSFEKVFIKSGIIYDYQFWVSKPTEKYLGLRGRFTTSLEKLIPNNLDQIYLCGNGVTVMAIKKQLLDKGYIESQIYTERYN